MSKLRKTIKSIVPSRLWEIVRSIHLAKRQKRAPKIGQFDDPEETQKAVGALDGEWRRRIRDVISSPDNAHIPRCEGAGVLDGGVLTMHNGIKVGGLSYYGAGIMNLLMQNKGVHEPQEERAFQDVLPWIGEGGAMLELGAYWGFYSLWFAESVAGARNFLLEPVIDNLEAGSLNFKLNGRQAVFEQAFVGEADQQGPIPTVSVDSFMQRHAIDRLAILHSDVQGAELGMLHGAAQAFRSRLIDFLFVSTHGNDIHADCLRFIEENGYRILASANLDESFADDGVIVAISPEAQGPDALEISKKTV